MYAFVSSFLHWQITPQYMDKSGVALATVKVLKVK